MAWVWLLFSFKGRIGRARYLVDELALLALWLLVRRAASSSEAC